MHSVWSVLGTLVNFTYPLRVPRFVVPFEPGSGDCFWTTNRDVEIIKSALQPTKPMGP